MSYTRTNWLESETPLSADNMNNIEDGIEELQDQKVDKVTGKGLSTNDYTTAEKTKLASIESEADVTADAVTYYSYTGNNPPTVYSGADQDITLPIGKSNILGIYKLIFANNSNAIIYGICLVGWEVKNSNLILHVFNPTSQPITAAKVTVGVAYV